jgi:hypothetical protein
MKFNFKIQPCQTDAVESAVYVFNELLLTKEA